jgi:hypothetical protein
MTKSLNEMAVSDVCDAITNHIDFMSDSFKEVYSQVMREKNINGQVLNSCDLLELKSELRMAFGDWELFKNWIMAKRSSQANSANRRVNDIINSKQQLLLQQQQQQQHMHASVQNSQPLLVSKPAQKRVSILESTSDNTGHCSPIHSPSHMSSNSNVSKLHPSIVVDPSGESQAACRKKLEEAPPRNSSHTPTRSPTASVIQGRKVEFFITPVNEHLPEIRHEPVHSPVHSPVLSTRDESVAESLVSYSSTTPLVTSNSNDSIIQHQHARGLRNNLSTQVTLLSFDEADEENHTAFATPHTKKSQLKTQFSLPASEPSTSFDANNPERCESSAHLLGLRQSKAFLN